MNIAAQLLVLTDKIMNYNLIIGPTSRKNWLTFSDDE